MKQPACYKCRSTGVTLEPLNVLSLKRFICKPCKKNIRQRLYPGVLQRPMAQVEWERKANEINGKIMQKYSKRCFKVEGE